MKNYLKALEKIGKSVNSDKTIHSDWNKNYFRDQKNRYIKDIEFYSGLDGISNVLEIGAAPFHLSACLKEIGLNPTILDINPDRFSWFINEFDLDVKQCNVEIDEIPVQDNSHDLVIFTEIFEHLRINPIETLIKINKKMKPGGLIYLTTPNFFRYAAIRAMLLGRPPTNGYLEYKKLSDIGHMGHVREYTKTEMYMFFENTGYEVIDFDYKQSYRALRTDVFKFTKTHMKFLAKKV